METELGSVRSPSAEIFDEISTRLLFSPTISPYSDEDDDQLSLLIRVLNGFSSGLQVQPACRTPASADEPQQNGTPAGFPGRLSNPRRLFRDDDSDMEDERGDTVEQANQHRDFINAEPEDAIVSLGIKLPTKTSWPGYVRDCIVIHTWFPFAHAEYKSAPQSSSEILHVDSDMIEMFEFENQHYTKWVYQEFFRYIYNEAKRRKVKGLSRGLRYSNFTPPWIRCRIFKGEEGGLNDQNPLFLARVAVTDIRDQRSTWGVKRLAYLLGAFYQEEPKMSVAPLERLLHELCSLIDVHHNKRRASDPLGSDLASVRRRIMTTQEAPANELNSELDPTNARHESSNQAGHIVQPLTLSSNLPNVSHLNGTAEIAVRQGTTDVPSRNRFARRLETTPVPIISEDEQPGEGRIRTGTHSKEEPTGSDSRRDESRLFNVRCAAGSSCRFRNSVIYQSQQSFERNGVTGSCRDCKNSLHDLCGGGEEGHMLCPPCFKLN